jgi:hypothetical protein
MTRTRDATRTRRAQRLGVVVEVGVLGPGLGQHVDRTGGQGLQGVVLVLAGHEGAPDQHRRGARGHDVLDGLQAAHDGQVKVQQHGDRRSRATRATASRPLRASPTTCTSPSCSSAALR